MLLLPQRHARAPFALRTCYLLPMCAFVWTADIQNRIFSHILSASYRDSLGKSGPNITEAAPGWSTCLVFGRVSAQSVSSTTFLTQIRGGIRGIVELQVLNEIEWVLSGHIPIQDFFDLIVGTRSVFSVNLFPAGNANATRPVIAPEVSLRLLLASRIGQFKIAYLSSNTCVATHSWNESFPAYFSLNNWQLPTISQNTKTSLLREYWKLCLAKISFLAVLHSHSTMREASP